MYLTTGRGGINFHPSNGDSGADKGFLPEWPELPKKISAGHVPSQSRSVDQSIASFIWSISALALTDHNRLGSTGAFFVIPR